MCHLNYLNAIRSQFLFEAKPLTTVPFGEKTLIVDLMASEDDLIQDLFRIFDANKKSRNIDSNSTKSSNYVFSNKSEVEIYDIDSNLA